MSKTEKEVTRVVEALSLAKTRATYGAVGALVGVHAQSVSQYLGSKRPFASWVVNAGTRMPTNYPKLSLHPDLQSNPLVIEDPEELRALVEEVMP